MCVQSQLEDHGTRLAALESKHNTLEDIAAVQAKLARIESYLFGAGGVPDVPRDKSNIKGNIPTAQDTKNQDDVFHKPCTLLGVLK